MLYAEIFLVFLIATSALELYHQNTGFYNESKRKLYQSLSKLLSSLSQCDFLVSTQLDGTTFKPSLLPGLVQLLNTIQVPLRLRYENTGESSETISNFKRFNCNVYIGLETERTNLSENVIVSEPFSVPCKDGNLMRDLFIVFLNETTKRFQVKGNCEFHYNVLFIDFEGRSSNYRLKMMKRSPVNPGPVLTQINDVHLVSSYSQLVKIFLAERFTRTVITLIPMISSKPRSEAAMRSSWYPEILKTADFASTYFKIIDALAQRHNFTVIYVKEFLFNQRRYPCNYIIFPIPNMIPGKYSQIVFSRLESWSILYTKSKAGSRNPLRNLIDPFDTEVWTILLLLIAVLAILSKFALKTESIWESLEITTAPLLSQTQTKGSTSKFKYTAWILLAILIANFYLAKLTCSFVSPARIVEDKALKELIHEGYKLVVFPAYSKIFMGYMNTVKNIYGKAEIKSPSFEMDAQLLQYLNQQGTNYYRSLQKQAAKWGNGSFGTLEQRSSSEITSNILSRVLNTTLFVTSQEFFVSPSYWQFALSNNDVVVQSFRNLQDSGVTRFWEVALQSLIVKQFQRFFRKTYSQDVELQNLNFMYLVNGQAGKHVMPSKLAVQHPLISGVFQIWKIILGFGVLIVTIEVIWFNFRNCFYTQCATLPAQ
ncbi:unnamed protein product [Allacma fusca]|uniref:Ionotropic receptor n=1 Tax=Allacma fusca TaxID=39272 RepID=A0A8J2KE31_9HEXA|nr:unnamed protein product [Allacma fusca]